ncbi:MAG: hypothetical protein D6701_11275, partial [Gemmatimonadetes bacterium]
MGTRAAALCALALVAACGGGDGGGGIGPAPDDLEVVLVSGDQQFALAGQVLPDPLQVAVRHRSDGQPAEGVRVRFDLIEGAGAAVEPASVLSDAAGLAEARLTLGQALGTYRVLARVDGAETGLELEAFAVLPPEADSLPVTQAVAGQTLVITGRNFSPIPRHNVVLFSGVRGRVTAASETELTVEVPPCLPRRTVSVQVLLGGEGSVAGTLSVFTDPGAEVALPIGGDTVVDAREGFACLRLGPGDYLVTVTTAGTVGGGRYDYELRGLAGLAAFPRR